MVVELFQWWYGPGWRHLAKVMRREATRLLQLFSVGLLVRTLFEPWKRIITPAGHSFIESIRATIDNLISRCVGFVVRGLVISIAGLAALVWLIFSAICLAIWPLVPVLVVLLVIRSFMPW